MKRAIKIGLGHITQAKRHKMNVLLEAYRAGVNFYIKSLWKNPGRLDKETLARLQNTRLSERYKSQALKQALEIVSSIQKLAKTIGHSASMPVFNGPAVLDAKFITIEDGKCSFDLSIKLSTLRKYQRITLPVRRTIVFNKWMNYPGARLIQGAALSESYLTIFIDVPDLPIKEEGKVLAVDTGLNKMFVDSEGNIYGDKFKQIVQKIQRKVPGSKSKQRAYKERTNYINQVINELPWNELRVLGVELLKNLKNGKKKGQSKASRKALIFWVYRQVLNRIEQKAQENRVCLVKVNPANTSRTCPICYKISKDNRRGESFVCINCGYSADSDYVGAQNILARTLQFLGSLESPGQ
jgi:IS605 OrfB family transposase